MENHNHDETKHVDEHEHADVPQTKKSSKGTVTALVIVIVLVVAAVGGTWYYMNNKAKNDKKAQDVQIQQLQKQVNDLKATEATAADRQAITGQVKAMYKYWIDGKVKDINYLLKNNYITQAVVDQSKNLASDLVSCSQSTLDKASDYQYGTPAVTSPSAGTMKVSGNYPGDYGYSGGPPPAPLIISLDLIKSNNIWKVNKINCPTP